MHGSRVYQVRQGHLVDTPEALVIWMRYKAENQWMIDSDEPVHRVIYDLSFAVSHLFL
jgi:hypothetical protein